MKSAVFEHLAIICAVKMRKNADWWQESMNFGMVQWSNGKQVRVGREAGFSVCLHIETNAVTRDQTASSTDEIADRSSRRPTCYPARSWLFYIENMQLTIRNFNNTLTFSQSNKLYVIQARSLLDSLLEFKLAIIFGWVPSSLWLTCRAVL